MQSYQPVPASQMQSYQPVKVLQRTRGHDSDKAPVSSRFQPPAPSLPSSSAATQMATMSETDAPPDSSVPASSESSQDCDWPNPYAQPGAYDMGHGWQYDESQAQAQAQALGYDINASGRYVYTDNDFLLASGKIQADAAGPLRPGPKFKALADLKIGHMFIRSCIDTGSTDRAIDAGILEATPEFWQLVLGQNPKTCVSVDGKLMKSLFSLRLPVHIRDKCYYQEFECIPGLIHPVILGTNFLKSREAVLDFGKNVAQFDNDVIQFTIPQSIPPSPPYLASMDNVVLQPESIQFVRADKIFVWRIPAQRMFWWVIVKVLRQTWQVIKPEKEIYIEMINPTSRPIHLCHGQPIADIAERNVEVKDTGIMRNLNSHSNVGADDSPNLFNSLDELQDDAIIADFFQSCHERLMDELSLDRDKELGQFCKFTPLFCDSLCQTYWELHQEDKMSGLDMDWIPSPIPPPPNPEDPLPVFQSTGDVLSGPPERDKFMDPIMEDVPEPKVAPEGGYVWTMTAFCRKLLILGRKL